MKLHKEQVMLDGIAETSDVVQVELQPELGYPNRFKLYVHLNGVTILRICKLHRNQIRQSDHQTLELLDA